MKLINLQFQLSNPFNWDYFKSLGSVHGQLTKHKFWELEHNFYGNSLLDLDFHIATKEDHAGISLTVGVLGYGVHFHIYDHRHEDMR
jgi:hypothetical protein